MMHLIAERIDAQNVWTECGRVVKRGRLHKTNCAECVKNTHKNRSFEMTRMGTWQEVAKRTGRKAQNG